MSLVGQWIAEAQAKLTPGRLKIHMYHGGLRRRATAERGRGFWAGQGSGQLHVAVAFGSAGSGQLHVSVAFGPGRARASRLWLWLLGWQGSGGCPAPSATHRRAS